VIKSAVERYGNINVRTIDRWHRDEEYEALKFPKPTYVGVTPLWDEAELEAWDRSRATPRRPPRKLKGGAIE
jgi:hypothetical protein